MRNQLIGVVVALLLAAPALADGASDATAPTPGTTGAVSMDEAHLDDTVCKKMPPATGSRIPGETVCMTNRQWIKLWNDAKIGTKGMKDKPHTRMPGG